MLSTLYTNPCHQQPLPRPTQVVKQLSGTESQTSTSWCSSSGFSTEHPPPPNPLCRSVSGFAFLSRVWQDFRSPRSREVLAFCNGRPRAACTETNNRDFARKPKENDYHALLDQGQLAACVSGRRSRGGSARSFPPRLRLGPQCDRPCRQRQRAHKLRGDCFAHQLELCF